MDPAASALRTLYQLNMIQTYLDHGETETAVFEFCGEVADALKRLDDEVDRRLEEKAPP